MDAIIVVRVSTEEQFDAGNSIPAQIERAKSYCKRKGLTCIKVFELEESAYKKERRQFDGVVNFILSQPGKVAVCFDKVDRLSRDRFDKRVGLLFEKSIMGEIELHFVSDGQIVSSKLSAVEKFNFGINLGLSSYYSDAISDNVKRAQEHKLRKGEFPGKAHYGYKNISLSEDKTDIIVDEYAAPIVKQVFEWYATCAFSMKLICKKLQTELGIKWSTGMVDRILKDKFYCGIMTWNDKDYPHRYPQIITPTLFNQVQDIKAGFNKKRCKLEGSPNYLYRGLLRCGHCGLAITPEKHKGHVYYHCTENKGKHDAAWLREEEITRQIGQFFRRIRIPADIIKKIIDNLAQVHQSKMEFHNQHFNELTKQHITTTKMLDTLYRDKLSGKISEEAYDKYYQEFRDKITDVDIRLKALQEAEDNYYTTANYVLDLTNRSYDLFIGSDIEERRQLLNLVLQNLRVDGKKVRLEAKKPFDFIMKCADQHAWLPLDDGFRNREATIEIRLGNFQTVYSTFKIQPLIPIISVS